MRHINNFFEDPKPLHGEWSIEDGVLSPTDGITDGQYIFISGSTHNDGVHRVADGVLNPVPHDERFVGDVWLLRPDASFLRLCAEIGKFVSNTPVMPKASETFGAYSYTAIQTENGVLTWQKRYEKELAPYRHMFTEVH